MSCLYRPEIGMMTVWVLNAAGVVHLLRPLGRDDLIMEADLTKHHD